MHAHNVTCIQYRHQDEKQTWNGKLMFMLLVIRSWYVGKNVRHIDGTCCGDVDIQAVMQYLNL